MFVYSGRSMEGARGTRPPLIFRPNWGLKDWKKKNFFLDRPPPPPYLRIWTTATTPSSPLSVRLDPPLVWEAYRKILLCRPVLLHRFFQVLKYSDFLSGTSTLPLTLKLKLPSPTAFLISLPIFLAIFTPTRPALILFSLVSFTPMLSSMCTARVKRTKRKNGECAATFRPCDVHKYLLRGLSFITNCRKGGGGQRFCDNVAGRSF